MIVVVTTPAVGYTTSTRPEFVPDGVEIVVVYGALAFPETTVDVTAPAVGYTTSAKPDIVPEGEVTVVV